MKKRISALNEIVNKSQETVKFPKVEGEFAPGYIYGTVKTHKAGHPLRPIIAQMSSPTYWTAKTLNRILTPYLPQGNTVKNSVEFIELLKTTAPGSHIATLDVENLFTNVPVLETIDYITDRVYRSDQEPIPIPENILRDLLKACTCEAPFMSHRGELYRQIDGIAMGSPLGVLFAEMYMAKVEARTFDSICRPRIY